MSNPTQPTNVTNAAPAVETQTESPVEKQSLIAKTKTFTRKHKSHLLGGAGLAALVTLSALVGRATAPSYELTVLEIDSADDDVIDVEIVSDETIEIA